MSIYQQHVFVCTNRRDADNPKGSCAHAGAEDICQVFKKELADRGLRGQMRANSSGCLDRCAYGPTVVVYPEGVWYRVPTAADAKEIVEEHLVHGRPVSRLRVDQPPAEPKAK